MLRRTFDHGMPVVADTCSTYVLRRLRDTLARIERQRVVQEVLGRGLRHAHQLGDRNGRQPFARASPWRSRSRRMRPTFAWLISTNGSRVRKCGTTVAIDALVRRAPTENRYVHHGLCIAEPHGLASQ